MRAAALLGAAALALAVFIACDDEARKPPFLPETSPTPTETTAASPTPLPTPSPTGPAASPSPELQGMDGFRAFAEQMAEAVVTGEPGVLRTHSASGVSVSSGDVIGLPLESVFSNLESLTSGVDAAQEDEFGTGEARLYALARRAEEPSGESRYQAIVTAIVPTSYGSHEPYRTITVYEFALRDGRWRLVRVMMDPHAGETVYPFAGAWLAGECGDVCFDYWERWEGPA